MLNIKLGATYQRTNRIKAYKRKEPLREDREGEMSRANEEGVFVWLSASLAASSKSRRLHNQ